ncbi:DUF1772 domain-containing protein [Heyndrickxia oleronia]|uniref:anthrone oxygenase family protein n=1 Tax=Heyndrickxia oleronia TaxID=38875 RepID=UPI003336017D
MINQLIPYVILFGAMGSGLVAGVFFAFSSFVMKALARLPDEQGIATMQSINIVVLNRSFLTVFLGTALVTILLITHSIFNWESANAIPLFAGSLLYFVGSFLVTVVRNVPLNDALARVDTKEGESLTLWKDYLSKWTIWNHIRTLASFAAMVLFILAL